MDLDKEFVGCMDRWLIESKRETFVYTQALAGDQSFAKLALETIDRKIFSEEGLAGHDRVFLSESIKRILASKQALNVVAGSERKRGSEKRGAKAFALTKQVSLKVKEGMTVEEAWAAVAWDNHVSESLVKNSWTTWKEALEAELGDYATVVSPKISGQEKRLFIDGYTKSGKPRR